MLLKILILSSSSNHVVLLVLSEIQKVNILFYNYKAYRLEIPVDGSKCGSTPGRHGRPNSSISESSESCGDKRDPVKAPGGDI